MREPKVYQVVLPLDVLVRELFAFCGGELERAADERLANTFIGFGDPGSCHSSLFVAEVDGESDAGEDEEEACLPGERL